MKKLSSLVLLITQGQNIENTDPKLPNKRAQFYRFMALALHLWASAQIQDTNIFELYDKTRKGILNMSTESS